MKNNVEQIGVYPPGECRTDSRLPEQSAAQLPGPAYALAIEKVVAALDVAIDQGLSEDEAAARLRNQGFNRLQEKARRSILKLLLDQFSSIIIWLLAVAAVVALLTDNALEAGAIFVVLVINALIGFTIEWQAGRALEALRNATKTLARVRRDGYEQIIETESLVAGDIIVLSSGDRVPADARICEAVDLQADESTLTGESMAVEKNSLAVAPGTPLADRSSMLYLGASIVRGRVVAVVTATGGRSELGRIGTLLAETESEKTPLERQLADLGNKLVYIVLATGAVVLIAGFLRGENLWLMVEVSISLAVAAVPEGLPAVTTLVLAFGVLRMARRNAIVRRLTAVETLGSTTVICTDKTGTLTENRMAVREYRLSGGQKIDAGAERAPVSPDFERVLRVGVLCSEASFHQAAEDDRRSIGDPTETALLLAAHEFGVRIKELRGDFEKIAEEPFRSATKKMLVVLRGRDGRQTAMMKGAPSVILSQCTHFLLESGVSEPLTEAKRNDFLAINDEMADRSLRVLGFAEKIVTAGNTLDNIDGYTFLGLAGMNDPLRPSAADAVRKARQAGIRVVMLTGDQLVTAKSIARELDLSEGNDIFALHSQDLIGTENERLGELAKSAHVFARVTPEDKLRIVEALQSTGEVVAVTGDGVNDAPALKKADIGIAMGARGTEVAKEAADMVLTDDNFATIVNAVEAGRTIYANIIRFVHLMFSKNLGEVLVIFFSIILNLPLPLLPLQILWVNLVTDIFPGLSLALEPTTPGTRLRPPRSRREALLSPQFAFLIVWQGALLAAIILIAYYWAVRQYGPGSHARTIALLVLIGGQIGHLFNCRSRRRSAFDGFWRNPFVFMAAAIVVSLQFLAIYLTPLADILQIVTPTAADWFIIGICSILPVVIVEAAKFVSQCRRRYYESTY